jgi:hypothetical protein
MAISTQAIVLAKRRAFNYQTAIFQNTEVRQFLKTLFMTLGQTRKNPNLQIVELADSSTTDQVVADAACKLYAVFLKCGSTSRDFRAADHASSANSPTITVPITASGTALLIHPEGRALTTGFTIDFSGAGATGFVVIGAP